MVEIPMLKMDMGIVITPSFEHRTYLRHAYLTARQADQVAKCAVRQHGHDEL